MIARLHEQEHAPKFLKIDTLLGFQRVVDEEWNDALEQVIQAPDTVGHSVAVVGTNDATSEERLQTVKKNRIALVLHDGEFGKNLKARPQVGVRIDADMKTALTVHKACDPLRVKLHWQIPNVKSLRVPCAARAFPADCPHVRLVFTARDRERVQDGCARIFPHMVRFY